VSPFNVPAQFGMHVTDLYPSTELKRPQHVWPLQSAASSHAIGVPLHWPALFAHV
jgi:hypothetical protein